MRLAEPVLVDDETARNPLTERNEGTGRGVAMRLLGWHAFIIDVMPEIVAMIDPVQQPECGGAYYDEQNGSGDEPHRLLTMAEIENGARIMFVDFRNRLTVSSEHNRVMFE